MNGSSYETHLRNARRQLLVNLAAVTCEVAATISVFCGCNLNPAVSVALWAGGPFPASELLPCIIAQVLAAIAGAALAGIAYHFVGGEKPKCVSVTGG